ncbi:MAG TPA: aldo/keto reductase [Pseudolysinimonas sp.]|nr:aldo/keto reductase [Pseudolysinimonas sp.]
MPILTDTYTLANGVQIPKIGFGTWQVPDGQITYDAVRAALDAGYRHIDSARGYGNEESVGKAVRDSGIPRSEIFVTTKLPADVKGFDAAKASFATSTGLLDLGYVDLYLIHAPWPWEECGADYTEGNIAAWRALIEIADAGGARAIGVSNFDGPQIQSLIDATGVVPQANQIQYYVGHTLDDVVAYCAANGILVEAYSPLATGELIGDARLREIADRYGKTTAQLAIRYTLQKGTLPLPKTTTPSRIVENADVDFEISAEDVALLDGFGSEK